MPQYLHEKAIRDEFEKIGGKIDLGVTLESLQQDDDGVSVELSETRDGHTTTVKDRYDWVVGADGGHSTYRSLHFTAKFC